MRVGISANPPWTVVRNGQFGGVEVALIQAFAREIDARIEWLPAGTPKLLKALEEFQLDLVIGGLTEETPWKKRSEESRVGKSGSGRVDLGGWSISENKKKKKK